MDTDSNTPQKSSIHPSIWVTLTLASLILLCASSLFAVNWYATTSPRAGLPVTFCAGISLSPRVQIGAAWQSLLSSYMSPIMASPLAVCTHVPQAWLTPTFQRHSWEFLWPP